MKQTSAEDSDRRCNRPRLLSDSRHGPPGALCSKSRGIFPARSALPTLHSSSLRSLRNISLLPQNPPPEHPRDKAVQCPDLSIPVVQDSGVLSPSFPQCCSTRSSQSALVRGRDRDRTPPAEPPEHCHIGGWHETRCPPSWPHRLSLHASRTESAHHPDAWFRKCTGRGPTATPWSLVTLFEPLRFLFG